MDTRRRTRSRRSRLTLIRSHKRRLEFEPLESRQLLSTVDWISPNSGNWNVGANWSTGEVPGPGDNVVIEQATSPTITISSGTQSVLSVTATDPIAITGGSLTVTSGTSSISGGLAMTGGSLEAVGSGVTFTVTGATTDTGGNLYAQNGAALTLSNLTSYTGGLNYTDTLEATGAGSKLSLPVLATIVGEPSDYYSWTQVEALAGGDIELPLLAKISGGPVLMEVDGSGGGTDSLLDVPELASFSGEGGRSQFSTLQASNGGAISDGSLTSLSQVNLPLDSTASLDVVQITSYTGGTLTFSAGTLSLPVLADVDGSTFKISGGVTLTLPDVIGTTGSSFFVSGGAQVTLPADQLHRWPELHRHPGSDRRGQQAVPAGPGHDRRRAERLLFLDSGRGLGRRRYRAATLDQDQWRAGAAGSHGSSGGTSSVLDVPELASFSGEGGRLQFSTLQASNGGAISDGSLTSLSQVNLPLDSTASLDIVQITSYTGGTLTFIAGTLSLPVLADVDGSTFKIGGGVTLTLPDVIGTTGSSFVVSGGAQVTLPALTSYTGGLNYTDALEATGAGSKLSLPVLATIAGEPNDYYSWTQVEALAGGDIELPLLTKISGGPVLLESDGSSGGTSSVLDVPELASFSGEGGRLQFSTLQASNGGVISDDDLTSLSQVNLPLDSTASLDVAQITSYTGGTLTFQRGHAEPAGAGRRRRLDLQDQRRCHAHPARRHR